MHTEAKLKEAFQRYVNDSQLTAMVPGQVVAVDEAAFTCDVEVNGLTVYDVRLRAALQSGDDGLLLIPKTNSWVLIGRIGKSKNQWATLMYSDLESAQFDMRTFKMQMDGNGLYLWSLAAGNTMAGLMSDFIIELTNMQVVTPAGTGTVSPTNIANLNLIKTKFLNLFKDAI